MNKWKLLGLVLALGLVSMTADAGTVNILWYTGGAEASGAGTYEAAVAVMGADSVAAGQNTWNVTFWTGGAMPSGTFNALVVASPEGFWTTNPDYTALNTAVTGGLSFNPTTQRVMLTGQDADWHFMNSPGPTPFNGPQGFLVDSINWAASGTGLGLVALGQDGKSNPCFGGASLGMAGFTNSGCTTDNVLIPGGVAGNPVNTGLTSAGLSNWLNSAHTQFTGLSSDWTGINVNGNFAGDGTCLTATPSASCSFVTILSASSSGGGITAPEPSSLMLLGSGLVGLFFGGKRKLLKA